MDETPNLCTFVGRPKSPHDVCKVLFVVVEGKGWKVGGLPP
jgi:hypothetical protein